MGTGHWQMEGSAAELYQRYLVPAIPTKWAEELVDRAQPIAGDTQADPALLGLEPETLLVEIRQETPLRAIVRMRDVVADNRPLTGDLADAGHCTDPYKSTA